jgi:hypothetical protein
VTFVYTKHDPEFVDDDGICIMNTLAKSYSWDLFEARFNGVKHVKVAHKHLNSRASILEKLFKTIPDVKIEIDSDMVELYYRPSLSLEFVENRNNVLIFKITRSTNMMDYVNCSLRFSRYRLNQFGDINPQTTLSTTTVTSSS